MAYEGYLVFDGTEIANAGRVASLAKTLGITTVRLPPAKVGWVEDETGDANYSDVSNAPWYDAAVPASAEFAGLLVLRIDGLDDSTASATPTEYTTDGGLPGESRSGTATLVVDARVVASTERGADFGKRWLARVLARRSTSPFCVGSDLEYFRLSGSESNERAHRRNVRMTRGISVTRKTRRPCSSMWSLTFTLTAGDAFEYGEAVPRITSLGADTGSTGPGVVSSGSRGGSYVLCPTQASLPVYDPNFPALVAPPALPDFYPHGWNAEEGDAFQRRWARINAIEPSDLRTVPIIRLTTAEDARMVRVSIWPGNASLDSQCGALFSAVITYLPAGGIFCIDGEQQAAYVEDNGIRRADSLVYSEAAEPIDWASISDYDQLLVTLDTFGVSVDYTSTDLALHTFETDSEGFTATNATAAQSSDTSQEGDSSLMASVTADGEVSVSSPSVAVTPGVSYAATAQVKSSVSGSLLYMRLTWVGAGGSVSGNENETDDTEWVLASVGPVVAPAGATGVKATVYLSDALAGEIHYIDSVTLSSAEADGGGGFAGGGSVRMALDLVPKSD